MTSELKVAKAFRAQARVMRNSRDPHEAIAAAQWEIFFESKILELEREEQQELKLRETQAHAA